MRRLVLAELLGPFEKEKALGLVARFLVDKQTADWDFAGRAVAVSDHGEVLGVF